jgi:hypothetical protein
MLFDFLVICQALVIVLAFIACPWLIAWLLVSGAMHLQVIAVLIGVPYLFLVLCLVAIVADEIVFRIELG